VSLLRRGNRRLPPLVTVTPLRRTRQKRGLDHEAEVHHGFCPIRPLALQRINDAGDRSLILILSDINMPGMSGLELLPQGEGGAT
jgi:CheY-like chemotaxis protein